MTSTYFSIQKSSVSAKLTLPKLRRASLRGGFWLPPAQRGSLLIPEFTEQMVHYLLPWRRPWRSQGLKGALPTNLSSKKHYHGVNVFLLSMMGYSSPYWMTFKQAQALGGTVRKGEKGTPVIYWSILEKKNRETGKIEKIPFIKHSMVFNLEQCEGIEAPKDDHATPIDLPPELVPALIRVS
jgi:antirestriction protein ArdC